MLSGSGRVAATGKDNIEARGSRCDMAEREEEPTVECPNCGALVPVGAPRCFICEELMPEAAKPETKPQEPSPEEMPPAEKIEEPQPVREEIAAPIVVPITEKPPEEARAPEAAVEAAPAMPTPAEQKAAKLKAAFEAGRIPREVYVGNLRALGIEVPPELEEAPAEAEIPVEVGLEPVAEIPPTVEEVTEKPPEEAPPAATKGNEEKAARLKAAYESGRIPKEVYVENLRTLGFPVPPELEEAPAEIVAPAEVEPEVMAEAPLAEEKAQVQPPEERPSEIVKAEMPTEAPKKEEVPAEPVPQVAAEPPPIKEEIIAPTIEEKPPEEHPVEMAVIPEKPPEPEKLEPPVGIQPEVEAPPIKEEAAPPKVEEKPAAAEEAKAIPPAKPTNLAKKAARLKKAYKTGRITKEIYADSLKALGLPVPPEIEKPPAKEEETKAVTPEIPVEAPPPKEEIAPPKAEGAPPAEVVPAETVAPAEEKPAEPSESEVKAAKLRALFEAGTITKDIYVGNLKSLGLPVPPELEAKSEEEMPVWSPPPEVLSAFEEAAPESMPEVVTPVEEELAAEAPQVEEAVPEVAEEVEAPAINMVSKGEIESPPRSYRGVAIASAGGFIYVLIWLLFIPMLGNFLSFLFTAIGAILIVVGYNVASNDAAAARRARTFKCPLCSERLDVSASECPNCGARFSD